MAPWSDVALCHVLELMRDVEMELFGLFVPLAVSESPLTEETYESVICVGEMMS